MTARNIHAHARKRLNSLRKPAFARNNAEGRLFLPAMIGPDASCGLSQGLFKIGRGACRLVFNFFRLNLDVFFSQGNGIEFFRIGKKRLVALFPHV